MKANTKEAKALIERITPLKVGDKLEFTGFLKGFGQPIDAHVTEVEAGHFWQFSLYWNSVHIQDVVIERLPDELVIDTLGA
jgi:hypothetical protein